jgi:hypothetical protein
MSLHFYSTTQEEEDDDDDSLCILKFEHQLPADWWKFVAWPPFSPNLAFSTSVDY